MNTVSEKYGQCNQFLTCWKADTFGRSFAVLLLWPGLGVDGFSASGVAAVEAQPMEGCVSELTNIEET